MATEAPVKIDLGGGGGGFGFVLSGVTGVHAAALNGRYEFVPEQDFLGPGGARIVRETSQYWLIQTSGMLFTPFAGSGVWPWLVSDWSVQDDGAGTPAFTGGLSPRKIDLGSDVVETAMVATNLTGANNDLIFTSKLSGRLGNAIRVRYVNPGTSNAALGVVVAGRDITVNLATNGSSQITSTATLVANAITANAGANALVSVHSDAGTGGVVTAMGWTSLSDGMGGLPLPPSMLTL